MLETYKQPVDQPIEQPAAYEIVEYKGRPARKYPDGSIRDAKGHWLERHPGGSDTQIAPASARTLAEKRWALHTERVRQRVTEELASTFPGVTTPEDAYAEVVAAQTMTLVGSEKPRFDDVDKLGQIMGARPSVAEQRAAEQQPTVIRHEYSVDPATLALLREIQQAQSCVVDAQVTEQAGRQQADDADE